jgi:transcriptional regulator with XRE-family HTH domain
MIKQLKSGKTFLQEFREDKKMTRKELAEIAGCSPRTIEAWEQKKADLGSAAAVTVLKIANALNVKIEDLIDDKG